MNIWSFTIRVIHPFLRPKIKFIFYVVILSSSFLAGSNAAESIASCRPSWMPKSVPEICKWKSTTKLPQGRAYPSAIAIGNNVYLAGGYYWNASTQKLTYFNDVMFASINRNGDLGKWNLAGKIANGRSGLGLTSTKNCLVIAGGSWSENNSSIYGNDVQTAHLSGNKNVFNFTTSPNRLITPRSNHTLLAYTNDSGTYLYAIAGVTQLGRDTVHLDTIEYARIDSSCNVGTWSPMHFDIKGGRSSPQAVISGNQLYVVGGWGDLDLVDIYSDVQYTTIREDGSFSPWRTVANRLTMGIYGHATTVISNEAGNDVMLLISGGQPSTGIYSDTVSYSYMNATQLPKNSTGPWSMHYKQLPQQRAGHAAVYVNGQLYLIGGTKAGSVYIDDVVYTSVKPGTP